VDREGAQGPERGLSRRKKPIRIWGINSERIKKFWVEYLDSCDNYIGIWISVHIFGKYVHNYLEKKLEHIKEQKRREAQLKEKEEKERRAKEQKEKEKEDTLRLRSRDKPKGLLRRNR
jgi:sugar-specific transcriptional regulator TrmB